MKAKEKETLKKLKEIGIRDPYILLHNNLYYMYGTRNTTAWGLANGFDVYVSADLTNWEGPFEVFHNDGTFWATKNYWAPECVRYKNRFYLIATFGSSERKKGIQILSSDSPKGPFLPLTKSPITPETWNAIDGTFHIDGQENPWLIFSHSLPEEPRGAMCAMKLSDDLTKGIEDPIVLFYADQAAWTRAIPFAKEEFGLDGDVYFSDGPFLFKNEYGKLMMIWSSWSESGYSVGTANSQNGNIEGPWIQNKEAFYTQNGGHGMLFRTKAGNLKLALHSPNETLMERATFIDLTESLS